MILDRQTTHNCAPSLSDEQVVAFCREGHLIFEGVVPENINSRCCDFLDAHAADVDNINRHSVGEVYVAAGSCSPRAPTVTSL